MSQNEEYCILSDGRKTSELKVVDLKKELDKFGKRKTGTKSELVTRLNEALSASTKSTEVNHKERQVDSNKINTQKTKYNRKSNNDVDLDDSDDVIPDGSEMNQSVDTLELGVPIDDSLISADDITQEDQIQINLSKDEEADMNLEEKQCSSTMPEDARIVVREQEVEEDERDNKICAVENEPDEMLNIEMDATLEMYEGDNNDLDMEDCDTKKDNNEVSETITVTVKNEVNKNGDVCETVEETEEGEVVPITARLGKRKVTEENESDQSPKKTKKKGLRETKGAGHIIEEPLRMKSPQKSKNIISDILRVDNLVRPFTMTQLQDVLSLKGKVLDLWLNKIKSMAYVKYESESAAINARESLDGCKWPSINPKLLVADFATKKEMEWMKEKGDSGVNPPAYLRQQDVPKWTNDLGLPEWKNDGSGDHLAKDRKTRERPDNQENKLRPGQSIEKPRRNDIIKEGHRDLTKEGHKDVRKEGHKDGHHRDGHRGEHREKGHEKSKDKKKSAPTAVKLLEDLFRKTTAAPAIYWLPVSRDKNEDTNKVDGNMIVLGCRR